MIDEQCRLVAFLSGLQAKVNALPAHAFGRLQVKGGEKLSALMAKKIK